MPHVTRSLAPLREWLREALLPLGVFATVLVGGVVGFVLLAGVGVVEAAFWLLDPTSIELHFRHHDGPERATKGFALAVFAGLFLAGIWLGETVLDAAFGGRIREEITRMQRQQAIDDCSDHVVICGYGMFGRSVAQRLDQRGRDVVVVERSDSVYERIEEEVLAVDGDARREEILRRAGIDRAAAVVAGIDDSNANIQIAITTSQLAPDATLVVRVGDEMYESLARRAGADTVVIPEVVSADDVVERL